MVDRRWNLGGLLEDLITVFAYLQRIHNIDLQLEPDPEKVGRGARNELIYISTLVAKERACCCFTFRMSRLADKDKGETTEECVFHYVQQVR
jgi:hypothetical protein